MLRELAGKLALQPFVELCYGIMGRYFKAPCESSIVITRRDIDVNLVASMNFNHFFFFPDVPVKTVALALCVYLQHDQDCSSLCLSVCFYHPCIFTSQLNTEPC